MMKTLRDLIDTCNDRGKVYDIIHQEYYSDKTNPGDYGIICVSYDDVLEELLHKPSKLISEKWKICLRPEIDDFPPVPVTYIDVCLLDSKAQETYALDMVPWEDLIDYGVVYKSDIMFDVYTTLAHILWEITFYGYTEEKVMEVKSEIEEQCRRIDSGEEKLIPWEEIKKNLDEK